MDSLAMQVTGVEQCVELLRTIKNKKAKNALRSAISRAGTILLQTIRPLVPMTTRQATGLLKRSMGKKDSNQYAKRAYSIVGPRRGFAQRITPLSSKAFSSKARKLGRAPVAARGRNKDPVRYAHLVGKGHKSRNGFVRGRNFMLAGRLIAAAQMKNVIELVLTQRLVSNVKTDTGEGL